MAELNNPATNEEIKIVASYFENKFPSTYLAILECSNGLKLKNRESYLYSTNYLVERNLTYEVQIYLPNHILIGDNGGGKGIFISKNIAEDSEVLLIDLGIEAIEDSIILANSISNWVTQGLPFGEVLPQKNYPKFADVYLIKPPKNGAKDLLQIKKVLKSDISIGKLYKDFEVVPCRLLRAVPFIKYARICSTYNKLDDCLALYEVDNPNNCLSINDF